MHNKNANSRQRAQRFGLQAETWAAWFLRLKGYRILARQYRHKLAEIDIVAMRGAVLVIVEVKARGDGARLLESITPAKQKRLLRAGEALLLQPLARTRPRIVRFDIVFIRPWRWPRHIPHAWRQE